MIKEAKQNGKWRIIYKTNESWGHVIDADSITNRADDTKVKYFDTQAEADDKLVTLGKTKTGKKR